MKSILKKLLFVTVILVISFSCSKNETTDPYSAIENEILQLVNSHRTSMGLSSLAMNDVIYTECKNHSTDMGNTDSMNHNGSNIRFSNIATKFGGTAFAENVAYGQTSANQVVTDWLNSAGHKANIEGNYNYTGISVVKNSKGINYFTQIFVKK